MAASSSSSILNALSSSAWHRQGIDVTATVNQLIANLRGPEQVWQTQQQILQGQASALTQLNTEVTALSNSIDSAQRSGGRPECSRRKFIAADHRDCDRLELHACGQPHRGGK